MSHRLHRLLAIILWLIAIALWMPALPSGRQNHQTLTNQLSIPAPYQSLYEEVLAPVVKITSKAGTGSGVIIATTDYTDEHRLTQVYILTAAHVVGDENEVQVIYYSYRRDAEFAEIIKATVVITDTIKDLALLKYSSKHKLPCAKLASRDYKPYLFTPVYAVGCSLGYDPRPSEGILSALCASAVDYWEISSPILPGNSGGGVFLKDTHELIGITVWVRTYRSQLVTTMAGVVPLQDIYSFLDRFATEAQSTPRRKINNFLISETSVSPWLIWNLSVVPRGGLGADLTCWSSRGSDGAIGTRGPAGQPNHTPHLHLSPAGRGG